VVRVVEERIKESKNNDENINNDKIKRNLINITNKK
jgi:hypothetical protein